LREEWFNISFSITEGIGKIVLSDETGNNYISLKMLRELKNALKICHHSNDVRVILITGAKNCFSKGVDANELFELNSNDELLDCSEFGWKVFNKLSEIRKPIISEITGEALDAGFELVLLSDIAYAETDAIFGFPGISKKISPSFGGISNLVDYAGSRIAKELIYSGRRITAKEAQELGIINKVFKKEDLTREVLNICREISKNDLSLIGSIKETIEKIPDINRRLRFNCEKNSASMFRK
jgi:enoyl-CoA hydratase/carnithine racemase